MSQLLPLTFTPIFQTYLWGGRRLAPWFDRTPTEGPIAEAWLLSDELKFPSQVANGPFAQRTLQDLVHQFGEQLVGRTRMTGGRFPLLLKLLDARDRLSVQVHPDDQRAAAAGTGLCGKTEAWVVLHAEPGARLYAGLRDGVDESALRAALASDRIEDLLHSFEPRVGDCVFLPAGTIHAIGEGLLLFEVQQTSDLTYRLHDWGRVDPRTGQPRPLHIDEGIASIDFSAGPVAPKAPTVERENRQRLIESEYFHLWRTESVCPFDVGSPENCRIIVAVSGTGMLSCDDKEYPLRPGSTWLLPAEIGPIACRPAEPLTVLECAPPTST